MLQTLDLYSVRGRLLRADLLKCWRIFNGKCGIKPNEMFLLAPVVGTIGHRYKSLMCSPVLTIADASLA